jgi:TPR repeat protein
LGLLYQNGTGVKKSIKEAVKLFKNSSSRDNADAHYELAVLYDNGIGGINFGGSLYFYDYEN